MNSSPKWRTGKDIIGFCSETEDKVLFGGDPRESIECGRKVVGAAFTPEGAQWLRERGARADMHAVREIKWAGWAGWYRPLGRPAVRRLAKRVNNLLRRGVEFPDDRVRVEFGWSEVELMLRAFHDHREELAPDDAAEFQQLIRRQQDTKEGRAFRAWARKHRPRSWRKRTVAHRDEVR